MSGLPGMVAEVQSRGFIPLGALRQKIDGVAEEFRESVMVQLMNGELEDLLEDVLALRVDKGEIRSEVEAVVYDWYWDDELVPRDIVDDATLRLRDIWDLVRILNHQEKVQLASQLERRAP